MPRSSIRRPAIPPLDLRSRSARVAQRWLTQLAKLEHLNPRDHFVSRGLLGIVSGERPPRPANERGSLPVLRRSGENIAPPTPVNALATTEVRRGGTTEQ